MLGQYLITFREVFEAALIIAIILSYLIRTDKRGLSNYVWYGAYFAIAASLGLGVFIWIMYGTLSESIQVLFEAFASFIAVIVLSSMIYWMAIKGKYIEKEIEKRIEAITTRNTIFGLISISFIVVFREGFETILFLMPFLLNDTIVTLIGTSIGIIAGIALSYGIFIVGMKINIRKFFYFTSILLILLAGGLAGYGVHELIEYYQRSGVEIGWLDEKAYTLNIPKESLLHHKGLIGSIFAVMFGYTVSAEWARLIVHFIYLIIAFPLLIWIYKKKKNIK